MAMKQVRPARYHAADAERVVGCGTPYTAAPTSSTTATGDGAERSRRAATWLADQRAGADARRTEAAQDAELAALGDVHRERDQAERGEHDADVADDVVVVRGDAAELGIGRRAEDPGEHQHGRPAGSRSGRRRPSARGAAGGAPWR